MTLEEIKKRAIKIEDGMRYKTLLTEEEKTIDIGKFKVSENAGQYAEKNRIIAFIDDDGNVYVIPDISVKNVLTMHGYTRRDFYVPFCNWEYPEDEEIKWNMLMKEISRL